ncbi:MAG: hypothetical protein A3G33_00450 [Omnitrophica bacterium RIFCSPLOWO2_12_FULL_44_17]|uniref:Uncharacterized protein n=1 Tax=Candidatus Danuiimicrobium aquiferis TaxID=1801832 RepID=A0A1G1KSE2_9BACT|nr:MAG: hypothetical protein A3B72_08020 [Omnitrophica bacterium RIFCSPHIGHO2_02_FULL_45_28]OGW95846.1 MAG: hypothetical protein A3G33_00450 [Omnitrophica bacterium RIFCSPLOWO2_12_FULL_44_17]OGX01947.1 MAG: hypothetical protein A3J12_01860 [Omnitrophica bacterium RIFCSPLOWO2_02_FULL_44_11]
MAPEGRAEHGKRKFQARPDFERCPGLARGEATEKILNLAPAPQGLAHNLDGKAALEEGYKKNVCARPTGAGA